MNWIYFTDRDLGKRFPEILAAAGLSVERHQDHFSPDGTDEEWLEYCGKNRRIALTHNERIRYTPNELAAVNKYQVALLVVVGKASHAELANRFVLTLPRIERFLSEHQSPYIAKLYRPTESEIAKNPSARGSIKLWYPKER